LFPTHFATVLQQHSVGRTVPLIAIYVNTGC
jgi:hypothetical protein